MSSSLLDLGQTVHCSLKYKWQIASEATIQVAGISEIAQATGNSQQLKLLTRGEIWTRRGRGLRLSIRILLDGEDLGGVPGAARLLENLGMSLRDAELWSQLGILPTLFLPAITGSAHSNQHEDIVLSLAYASPSGTDPGPMRGRKCRPADVRAAQPPDGYPTVYLERINMTLNLSRYCLRPKLETLLKTEKSPPCSYLAVNGHFSDPQQGDPIQSMDGHQRLCSHDVDMDRWSLSQPSCPTDDGMLEFLSSGVSDHPILLRMERDYSSSTQDQDYGRGLDAGNNIDVESRHMHGDVKFHHLLELTDAALRTMIAMDPVRPSAGIRLLAASPGPKLAQISPALFSPGYLTVRDGSPVRWNLLVESLAEFLGQAISHRTPFISTIAYTMSSLSRRVVSTDLQTKLAKLSSLSPSPLNNTDDNAEQETPCGEKIRKVVKARLWRMLQKNLYNRGAARRLKPVKADVDAIHPRDPDEMLDDNPLNQEEPHASFRTEEYLDPRDPENLGDNYLDFDIPISAGGLDIVESGDQDLLHDDIEYMHQEDQEISSDPKNTYMADYNVQQFPLSCRVYADNESSNSLPGTRGVNSPAIHHDEGVHGVSFTDKHENHSLLQDSPPSNVHPNAPNDSSTFTYESLLATQRTGDDDEDILFHSEGMMEMEEICLSLPHTPSSPIDDSLFTHEHLLQIERSAENQNLLLPHKLHSCTVKGGRGANDYKSRDEDQDEMIEI